MLITTYGIVIRERNVGENDKFIDVLTSDLGVIELSAKGVKKITSKSFSSAQLFAYSKFCLNKKNDRYYINSAEPVRIFYDIRLDVENFALASVARPRALLVCLMLLLSKSALSSTIAFVFSVI